jgi:GntR family transcriptional regulator
MPASTPTTVIERRVPITSQVNAILLERLRAQEYPPGSRLPSESELASELGVSRASVRGALGRLAGEGLLIRKQGDGTYVNLHIDAIPTRMGAMWNFLRLIDHSGHHATIRLVSQLTRPATAAEAAALTLPEATQVLALTRVFSADDVPAILTHSAAPLHLLREPIETLHGDLPVSDFVRQYYREGAAAPITYTIFEIHATTPDAETCEHLQVEPGMPLLELAQVFYDRTNRPVFYSLSIVRDKIIKLRLAQSWD